MGAAVHKSGDQPFAPDGPAIREVAVLHAPAGRQRFSIWLPHLRIGERATLRIERDLWVVVEIGPERRKGLRVFDEPPHGALGDWTPLVAVPR